MYQGKHVSDNAKNRAAQNAPKRKRRLRWRKEFVILVSAVALLTGLVGGTVAYLVAGTQDVRNTFVPAHVDSAVSESFENNEKANVGVTNTSDVTAYLRATLSVRWENDQGQVYAQTPSYTMAENLQGSDWFKSGDIYYYAKPVAAGATTPTSFITSVTPSGDAPDGYHLVVEVLTEAIQADGLSSDGKQPVAIAWGVTVNSDGTISK